MDVSLSAAPIARRDRVVFILLRAADSELRRRSITRSRRRRGATRRRRRERADAGRVHRPGGRICPEANTALASLDTSPPGCRPQADQEPQHHRQCSRTADAALSPPEADSHLDAFLSALQKQVDGATEQADAPLERGDDAAAAELDSRSTRPSADAADAASGVRLQGRQAARQRAAGPTPATATSASTSDTGDPDAGSTPVTPPAPTPAPAPPRSGGTGGRRRRRRRRPPAATGGGRWRLGGSGPAGSARSASGRRRLGPGAVQPRVAAARRRSAPRACPTRRSARARGRRSGRPGGSSTAGGRSRSPSARRAAARAPARSRRSVRTSTFDVASSRIRIRGSASSARAKATSWRWPADSCAPRSPTSVSIPSAQPLDERVGADGVVRRPRMSSSLASGRPKAMFSAIVPENRKPSWGTIPSWLRSAFELELAHVVPVDQHPPALRVVEAGDQLRQRRLAGARSRRPAPRSGRPGRAGRCSVPAPSPSPRRRVVARRRTRRPSSSISPRDLPGSIASGRVDHVGLGVEQVEDLVERRHPLLVGRVELRDLLDRVEELRAGSRRTRPGRRSAMLPSITW